MSEVPKLALIATSRPPRRGAELSTEATESDLIKPSSSDTDGFEADIEKKSLEGRAAVEGKTSSACFIRSAGRLQVTPLH